ncbi:aspartyl-phosphate phosphatase Spo0E family protein [Sediminibacillus albus]|uniref:Spo0E like sporulation regulatory protein n=1 Tax=Sediminibacillus albus TaxID=407036 RepID=A0A1G8WXZ2_9BACI|nr:aspartyl-phosphate phosphatase Spo0E family protein [Sediminibacillus albus]SDJ82485.1 Spo0E like sporulation regulatory protein [Sediminibacillus albus]
MKEIEEMEKKIENLRVRMYQVFQFNPDSPEILKLSQRLDDALNQFDLLKKGQNGNSAKY